MRKLFWMIILLGAYVWVVTSGHEDFIFDQGRTVYRAIVSWFDGADVDFQDKKTKSKKKNRRWD